MPQWYFPSVVVDFQVVVTRGSESCICSDLSCASHTDIAADQEIERFHFALSILSRSRGNNNLQQLLSMVKVAFNKALAVKDPKKESLITGVQVLYLLTNLAVYLLLLNCVTAF